MKKLSAIFILILSMTTAFSGCAKIGEKSASLVTVYGIMAVLAIIMLLGYFCIVRKKETWFTVLFSSVAVVNAGYFCLSASTTLEEALLANRISYLGSAFLPFSMLMIMLDLVKIKYKKWIPGMLLFIGAVVFVIAASPGYLDIYYKEVSLVTIGGASALDKIYGPLHFVYLLYLLSYLVAMIGVAVYAAIKRKMDSTARIIVFISAFSVNIGVWFIEQIVKIDFELLSVSYIISELFLLMLHLIVQEEERLLKEQTENTGFAEEKKQKFSKAQKETCEFFAEGFRQLTPAERKIYGLYIEGKTTAEIREKLNITENTLKYHNKNIYNKLGVSSKKELLEVAKMVEKM
ncbi:MAG: hypothetical protein IJ945_03610 [Oscillospiraceae bacterium]|nr:hypothetical protein [Oscillospiraceae bacterium]